MARPLGKVTKNGKPYTRPPDIEAGIDELLGQSFDEVLRRARIRNPNESDYVPSECLLHLARDARLAGETNKVDRLLPILLTRCEARLKVSIPDGGLADASGLRDEVLQAFSELFARVGTNHDQGHLDFFEIRFNRALAALRFKRLAREQRRSKKFETVKEITDEDGTPLDEENVLARLSEAARSPAQQENYVFLAETLDFIATLPAEEREAVMLCYVKGYKVESEDPDEVTAATLCNVSGRTIRSRLKKAAMKLKQFKQES